MARLQQICQYLEQFAPARLAEEWDNVGLLVGRQDQTVSKVMTCLTITPDSAEEAIHEQAQLIVTHHPFPFRPLKRLTNETTVGRLLLQLVHAGVAVYSPHTAFDSAQGGINQRLAEGLGLQQIRPLLPVTEGPEELGTGRWGYLSMPRSVHEVAQQLKSFLGLDGVQCVGSDMQVARVAVACGSAGQLMTAAREAGCQLLVTGETNFHTCLEAEATGIALLLAGHFASERFAVEYLAEELSRAFEELQVWPSRREHDPLRWV